MTAHSLTVTSLYAGSLALWYLVLSMSVIRRRRTGVPLGDGGDKMLQRAIRGHGNFAEYVPLALFMLALLEINGASQYLLHGLGTALLAARLLHGYAFAFSESFAFGRYWGTLITFVVLGTEAISCLRAAVFI